MEMATMRAGRSWVGIGGGSTRITIVAFTIPLRPRLKPRETLLNQQLRWCAGSGAIVASSARKQWKRNRNKNHSEAQEEAENIGGVGQAVLAALKSGVPQPNNSRISKGTDERRSKEGERRGTETELSGSDVLLALQRAAAEAGRGKVSGKRRKNGRGGGGVSAVEDTTDYSNVRPLKINRDWGYRLDELERRLQDLMQL